MGKNITVLSDGTGNSASKVWRTNVWRIYESLDLSQSNQIAKYDDGVGSSSFKPLALLGGVFGWGLKRNVLDLYTFLCRNYQNGDRIYAFGFSRGAFTIRVLLGLLLNQGLVPFTSEAELQRKARAAYRAYRRERYHTVFRHEAIFRGARDLLIWLRDQLMGGARYHRSENIQVPSVRFVGVWDTVAAYGLPIEEMTRGVSLLIWPLELPDRKLDKKVVRACHALATDDERTTFHPVLWSEANETRPPPRKDGKRYLRDEQISQVWFCGVHSNVGGGYPDDALAHIPLYWIMQEAKACGLRLKASPRADPDAMRRVASAQDIDGRLYDPRTGLGGYYRYGPRKIAELCCMRFSSKKEDAVEIANPKIHETTLRRIQTGTQGYAPFNLPGTYAVAMCDGTVVENNDPPFESTSQAEARAQFQERIWNLVWWRRVVYFATIAASLHLALFPLFHQTIRTYEFTTDIRWVSELIRIIGAFLPWFATWWIDAFAANPWSFGIGVAVLVILIRVGVSLAGRISDGMRHIWQDPPADTGGGLLPADWLFRLRTSNIYTWLLWRGKRYAVPVLSAALLAYLALGLTSHFAFNVQDSTGAFCRGSADPHYLLPDESRKVGFDNNSLCWPSGLVVVAGTRYRIHVRQEGPWQDGDFVTSIDGFEIAELPRWTTRMKMFAATPLRRVFLRPWFRMIARIGESGTDEYFIDRDHRANLAESELKVVFRTRREGELFFYVNDAVIGIPWFTGLFYHNNRGTAEIELTRLPD